MSVVYINSTVSYVNSSEKYRDDVSNMGDHYLAILLVYNTHARYDPTQRSRDDITRTIFTNGDNCIKMRASYLHTSI